ncbi:DsrE family protein [Dysgonomonas sp. Marseille-P4677]|uniref:DsrE family protein n=1 Tax=Dysgonomonas sp. Marseille-P4677 TaxID=2364790 RepID=UPI001F1D418F|nr:DsrE family protein [Dysgonomonas sp. Marseille-P4677]
MNILHILWITDNKDTFFEMITMYACNSKRLNWWKNVNIIIWGASVRLAGNDTQVQSEILEMLNQGITVEACKDCCDNFVVTEKLKKLGVVVRYMGEPLTKYIKNNEKFLSI